MPLRQLLNVAHASLVEGLTPDGVKEFDEMIEAEVLPDGEGRGRLTAGQKALMVAGRMPQKGAGTRRRERRRTP